MIVVPRSIHDRALAMFTKLSYVGQQFWQGGNENLINFKSI
jgi:hypothetical protein